MTRIQQIFTDVQSVMICMIRGISVPLRRLRWYLPIRETHRVPEKRKALWAFSGLNTLRQTILHRAGRLTSPQGTLTLTMSANRATEEALLSYLDPLREAA